MTNSFYSKNKYGILENFGDISFECKHFLRQIFTPNADLKKSINNVFEELNINQNNNYNVIHLRLGDNFIHNNIFDQNIFEILNSKINKLLDNHKNDKFILLSDSSEISNKLKQQNHELYYWKNKKIHIGDLKNTENTDLAVKDTFIDFFIMSQSMKIYSYAFNNISGFSKMVSIIFDIDYITI